MLRITFMSSFKCFSSFVVANIDIWNESLNKVSHVLHSDQNHFINLIFFSYLEAVIILLSNVRRFKTYFLRIRLFDELLVFNFNILGCFFAKDFLNFLSKLLPLTQFAFEYSARYNRHCTHVYRNRFCFRLTNETIICVKKLVVLFRTPLFWFLN